MPILAAELRGLVDAGAVYIQIDEPSPAIHPEDVPSVRGAVQRSGGRGAGAGAARGAPVLATTSGGRSRRAYRPVLGQALAFQVDDLVLEWANREMAELDVATDIAGAGRSLGARVVDVKATTSSPRTRSPCRSSACWMPACRPGVR
ncbi:MAG: hypothetical protein U0667_08125 [Chloroflexota bacterium]